MRSLAPRQKGCGTRAAVRATAIGIDANQAIRVRKRQRAEDDRVDDAEDCGGRTDTDGQRQRGDRGEPRHASELSQRITRVLPELVDPFCTAHISLPSFANAATGVVDSIEVAEATDGFGARDLGLEPTRDVFARAHLDVERELGVDFVGDARFPQEGSQLATECPRTRHGARWARDGPLGGQEDPRHGTREPSPFLGLGAQLLASRGGELVKLRLSPELGLTPLGFDPSFAFHAVERRVERAFFDDQLVGARVLEPPRDGVPVPGSPAQGLEDQGVQRAVKILCCDGHVCVA